MEHTLRQYDNELEACRSLFLKKTEDYGTSWRILRPSSLTDQIFIKASRIRSIDEKGISKVEEPLDDAFRAMVNYGIMALVQLSLPLDDMQDTELELDLAIAQYDKFATIVRDLMIAKNHDYGEAWRDMRVKSLTDLILVKILRIKEMEDNQGQSDLSEGIDANLYDMINYSIFALIKLGEAKTAS